MENNGGTSQDWIAYCNSVPGHRLFHVFLEDGRYHALPATGALAGMQVKPSEAWNQKPWETVVCSCFNGVPVVVFVFFCGRGRFQNAFSNGLFGMLLHRQLRERGRERENTYMQFSKVTYMVKYIIYIWSNYYR